ncbi:M48 family metalloprotease [Zhouia spongiae]|uniref:M48 family metalloprotease n=1 Tax=Zhouia spongiae TaxID=2202721 RepID=A0ABY3YJK2_9FLAO|nr:M48 family metalloprotease [Zhouia spongiae]UNY97353.1 M48 family metalloprotease [Zhouia spongiae]
MFRRGGNWKVRIFIGILIVGFAVVKKCGNTETNPYTGRVQHIDMSAEQEIAIGIQSAPEMAGRHGGLYPDERYQQLVDEVGNKLVRNSVANDSPYQFDFHLLADDRVVNAFALPGGQVFITYALFSKLQNEDQLAGVLGHEIGHVIGRHSAERIADSNYWQTIAVGANVGADAGGLIAGIGENVLLSNGRDDELESDVLGVRLLIKSDYNPEALIGVMEILKSASGGANVPEFRSTHPDPDNRIERIKEAIAKYRMNN